MSTMNDADRDAFLLESRLGTLAIARDGKGPLLAPIWYQYTPGATIDIFMSGSSAKAARLRAAGRGVLYPRRSDRSLDADTLAHRGTRLAVRWRPLLAAAGDLTRRTRFRSFSASMSQRTS